VRKGGKGKTVGGKLGNRKRNTAFIITRGERHAKVEGHSDNPKGENAELWSGKGRRKS